LGEPGRGFSGFFSQRCDARVVFTQRDFEIAGVLPGQGFKDMRERLAKAEQVVALPLALFESLRHLGEVVPRQIVNVLFCD
jgi:hypothetical protein